MGCFGRARPWFRGAGVLTRTAGVRRLRQRLAAAALGFALSLANAAAAAVVLHVDAGAPPGGDGSSWAAAFRFLQDALAAAASASPEAVELRVAQGRYTADRDEAHPEGTGDRKATFNLQDAMSIRGGYAGLGAPDPDQRDITLYPTVLSGDLAGDDQPPFGAIADNSRHVVTGSGVDASAVLDGVTITAGNADGIFPDSCGAGLYLFNSAPMLIDCTMMGNSADHYGGAVFNLGGSAPLFDACALHANRASEGGAVYNTNASPTFAWCAFSGNEAVVGGAIRNAKKTGTALVGCVLSGNTAVDGGAIYNSNQAGGVLLLCDILGNAAEADGGAVLNDNAGPIIRDCLFADNSAGNSGGAVVNRSGSDPLLVNCRFTANSATLAGGILNQQSHPILQNCVLEGNHGVTGGAMRNDDHSHPTVVTCQFLGNTAMLGAGVYNLDGSNPVFDGCTIEANDAESLGGGMLSQADCLPVLLGCSLLANTADSGGAMYSLNGCHATLIACVIGGNTAQFGGGISNTASSPLLVNCLLAGNAAGTGGALFNDPESDPSLINCTVASNSADVDGGGLAQSLLAAPELANCILWWNSDAGGTDESAQLHGGAPIVNYCCLQGWTGAFGGAGNMGDDPLFVDPKADDYRLMAGSPCIDAGNNAAVPPDVCTDLSGYPRFVDDPDTDDTGVGDPPIVDMGACEFQVDPCPADVAPNEGGDGVVDALDLLALLAAWGEIGDAPADINHDGIVDILDLVIVLDHWGPCPPPRR